MIKQMLKMANVPNEKKFLEKYPTEADFLREHGAQMLYMYGGSYADGGMAPEQQGMEQGQPQEGGGQEQQMQQLIQFIGQALQQGMQPQEIVQKLVEAGLPEDQAMQLVQAVMEQMQGGGGQGGAPQQGGSQEMMQGPEGQGPPPEEMAQGEAPMGMYGGSYGRGGQTFKPGPGTYYQGNFFSQGGPFIPQYGDIAWNVDYAAGGQADASNQLMMQVAQMLQQGIQPEAILQQLVQAKIPQKKAVKLIQTVMQELQKAGAPAPGQTEEQPMMYRGGLTKYPAGGITVQTTIDPNEAVRQYNLRKQYEMLNETNPYYNINPSTGTLEAERGESRFMIPDKIQRTIPNRIVSPDSKFGDLSNPQVLEDMRKKYNTQMQLEMLNRSNPEYSIDPNTGRTILKNKRGGSTKTYKKGGEYEMSHDDIQKLIQQGYKIQYL